MAPSLKNPTVRDVLLLLGVGTLVVGTIAIPALPMAVKPVIDFYKQRKHQKEAKEWARFNQWRLRKILKRLYDQKTVEIIENGDKSCIRLTEKGKIRVLSYKLEEIMIKRPPKWDGKWRIIIYDIQKEKRLLSEIFRRFLRKMEFLKLQKSVYLTPYPCDKQIEFLRQYYGLGEEVLYLVVEKLENEQAYKEYFIL